MISKTLCTCKGTHYVTEDDRAYFLQRDAGGDICLMRCPVADDSSLVYEQMEMIEENPEHPETDDYVAIIAQLLDCEV